MRTIAVLQQKGGCGKTTLATNLAAAAKLEGMRTLVVDLDRQGSALDWSAARPEGSQLDGLTVVKADRALSIARLREITKGFEVAVLDGPPRLGDVTRAAAAASDVVLIPCGASAVDMWALSETLELLDGADQIRAEIGRKPVKRLFVVNRAPWNAVLTRQTPIALAKSGNVSDVIVHHRIAFAEALGLGESVLTTEPTGAAAHEIRRLYREVRAA